MSEIINLTIDGKSVQIEKGKTILEAARKVNVDIPTLCFLKEINEIGDCRICLVEVEGRRGYVPSCITKVEEGMVVRTNTPDLVDSRRLILDLILSNHDRKCLTCTRNGNCELQSLAQKFNMTDLEYDGEKAVSPIDDLSPSIVRDPNKCVLCRRCVATCKNIQKIGAIASTNRGFNSAVEPTGGKSLNDVNCTFCGQCIESCPVGALKEKDSTKDVWKALRDPEKKVIVQTAPAVRVALGEEFGMDFGTNCTGKMVTALKRLGFDKVFDTDTGADVTIVEEATEFIDRLKSNKVLPMITSCSPGWVRYIEMNYPELLPHLSTCKSPHQMFGAILKSYYAEKNNINPRKIYTVSVMPCIAKKFERTRDGESFNGMDDVDSVITTRELARMIKQAGIDFVNLEDSTFDDPMGEATGAGVIFGTTGGVMEAALRTASEIVTGKELQKIEFNDVRGGAGIKKANINIGESKIKVAVASGLGNAREILEEIKSGKADYQFVEIMACPGGCVMGGGQPICSAKTRETVDVRSLRANALYKADEKSYLRKSHENPAVIKMYEEFFGNYGSHKAHELLHTKYCRRDKYVD